MSKPEDPIIITRGVLELLMSKSWWGGFDDSKSRIRDGVKELPTPEYVKLEVQIIIDKIS